MMMMSTPAAEEPSTVSTLMAENFMRTTERVASSSSSSSTETENSGEDSPQMTTMTTKKTTLPSVSIEAGSLTSAEITSLEQLAQLFGIPLLTQLGPTPPPLTAGETLVFNKLADLMFTELDNKIKAQHMDPLLVDFSVPVTKVMNSSFLGELLHEKLNSNLLDDLVSYLPLPEEAQFPSEGNDTSVSFRKHRRNRNVDPTTEEEVGNMLVSMEARSVPNEKGDPLPKSRMGRGFFRKKPQEGVANVIQRVSAVETMSSSSNQNASETSADLDEAVGEDEDFRAPTILQSKASVRVTQDGEFRGLATLKRVSDVELDDEVDGKRHFKCFFAATNVTFYARLHVHERVDLVTSADTFRHSSTTSNATVKISRLPVLSGSIKFSYGRPDGNLKLEGIKVYPPDSAIFLHQKMLDEFTEAYAVDMLAFLGQTLKSDVKKSLEDILATSTSVLFGKNAPSLVPNSANDEKPSSAMFAPLTSAEDDDDRQEEEERDRSSQRRGHGDHSHNNQDCPCNKIKGQQVGIVHSRRKFAGKAMGFFPDHGKM